MSRATRGLTDADLMRRGLELFLRGVGRAAARGSGRAVSVRGVAGRAARAWRDDLLSGYLQDPARILTPLRSRSSEEVVALGHVAFSSICRHHLLPFSGRAHLLYAPAGRLTGLSRLSRLVGCLSRRLQLQETLTREIAAALQQRLKPHGALCVIEATHTCLTMRGEGGPGRGILLTVAATGVYRRDAARRREALGVLGFAGRRPQRGRPVRRSR